MFLSYWIFVNSLWEKNEDNLKKYCRVKDIMWEFPLNFLKSQSPEESSNILSKKKKLPWASVNIKFNLTSAAKDSLQRMK